ncbi:hypothetical protein Tco_0025520 [Tanacetum coccineum]
MASISIGGVSQKSLINHSLNGFRSHVVWLSSAALAVLTTRPACPLFLSLCLSSYGESLSSVPDAYGQSLKALPSQLVVSGSKSHVHGGGMYRDSGSGGSGGDDNGSNGDGTDGDEYVYGAVHLARRSPTEGGDSEVSGDGSGVGMARSLELSHGHRSSSGSTPRPRHLETRVTNNILLRGGYSDSGISSLWSTGGGMYRDGGSGGSEGDGWDTKMMVVMCDVCWWSCAIARYSPAEGGDSEIGGDGGWIVMAKGSQPLPYGGRIWSLSWT